MSLFQCPHCRGTLENDGTIQGQVACPRCGGQFLIPPKTKRHKWAAWIVGGIAATAVLLPVGYRFATSSSSPGNAAKAGATKHIGAAAPASKMPEPTEAEKRLVRQWWRENEPDPESIEPIRWEAGTIERDPGWKDTRVIWVKYRHQHALGGKNVTESIFRISPQKGFNFCDRSEFRGWYWNWPAFVGP